ncbi:MAG: S8 family serine peptidase, partial [Candidatus Cloacimonadota bacterium]|nr:S8 family serine peptidase [Candidatus Cloacimonadota bacterium]
MKKITILILIFAISLSLFSSFDYDEDKFVANTIVVCFEMDSVDNIKGDISFAKDRGVVVTQMESFNEIARTERIIDLSQMSSNVQDLEWNDNGAYIQCIYRLKLASNKNMDRALNLLWQDDNIIYAQFEIINKLRFEPNDPSYDTQWHLPQIHSEEMWDYIQLGQGALIGIVDSGVKWNHPDLQDNIWINQEEIDAGCTIDWANGTINGENGVDDNSNSTQYTGQADDAIGWSFAYGQAGNNTCQTYAANDHGTHVAGCAAAVTNNNVGVCGSAGPADNIKILGTRHSSISSPSSGIANGYDGIAYCADMGADIINCSWGGPGSGYYPNQYINYATNQGALVVTAAGNDNTEHNASYQDYPSDCDNALCVAATTQNDSKASFSDYGDPIDISAPGVDIISTIISNNGYASFQGTSMASPIVAGVAAAVKSVSPELSPLEIRTRLMNTADYIDDVNDGYEGLLGTGRVNSFRAVMAEKLPNLMISNSTIEEAEEVDGVNNPGELINFDIMLENDYFFLTDAEDISLTLSSDMDGVTIVNGSITFPDMSAGVALWSETPFSFETVETLSELTIPLDINITANENWEYPLEKTIRIDVELSLEQAGWPFALSGASNSSPLIIDITGNLENEIVFGDQAGNIQVMNHDGSSVDNFPVNLGAQIASAVAVSDIDNDGFKEIVAATNSGL